MIYYTNKEMTKKMDELVKQGKSPFDILKDPKCDANFKKKIYKLFDVNFDYYNENKKEVKK